MNFHPRSIHHCCQLTSAFVGGEVDNVSTVRMSSVARVSVMTSLLLGGDPLLGLDDSLELCTSSSDITAYSSQSGCWESRGSGCVVLVVCTVEVSLSSKLPFTGK